METIVEDAHAGVVSPELVVDALFACRKTAAIRAAIELDLFTHIGEGKTAALLASATGASERGVRILCDYLVVHGFLRKESGQYRMTPSTRMFLDRNSPAYMGSAVEFVAAPEILDNFLRDPAAVVRNGGSAGLANISADNPVWLKFARGMGSFTGLSAKILADEISGWTRHPKKVLDIAAGPGFSGSKLRRPFYLRRSSPSTGPPCWSCRGRMRKMPACLTGTRQLPAVPSMWNGARVMILSCFRIFCTISIYRRVPNCYVRSSRALQRMVGSSRWISYRTKMACRRLFLRRSLGRCSPARRRARLIRKVS